MKEYKKAPAILTGKDLDYLKDIFGWNYNLYKVNENFLENIENKEIYKLFEDCNSFVYDNMNKIISILDSGDFNE